MKIVLTDGSFREVADGLSGAGLAELISPRLLKKSVAVEIDGQLSDLSTPLHDGAKVRIITEDDPEGVEVLRHSAAHLMAQSVQRLFEGVQVTIGPVIESGFYYDFDTDRSFTEDDLRAIESEMAKIAKEKHQIARHEVSAADAVKRFEKLGEGYKVEIINDLNEDTVSIYSQGDFEDLCRGPHLNDTSSIKHFRLLSVAGAYWRGNENNKMLQRIYGTAFFKKSELDEHLNMLEEAKKRDHRVLGKQLKLFMMDEKIGGGFPVYLPNGGMMRYLLEEFERKEHFKKGYDIVYGPHMLKKDMWVTSGHFDNYRENMYFANVEDSVYGIRPMNCLSHIAIYKSELRSYRDLPVRYFELGNVHRHERSGVLHGLFRVRGFTQDDAHIFCSPEQLNDEIISILDFVAEVMDVFKFEYSMELSTRPEKSIGDDEIWELATSKLQNALENAGVSYKINEGDGAFYGPKIDVKLRDVIGRTWQCATIQADFNLPERFDLSYVDRDGVRRRPVMLHRVILGSIDRFLGILIEHFAGAFPLWIAPTQVKVMNITDGQIDYAQTIAKRLQDRGLRVELDVRNEKIGLKIREAQLMKVPHMVIVGDAERDNSQVSVRLRSSESKNNVDFDDYMGIISGLVLEKSHDLWR